MLELYEHANAVVPEGTRLMINDGFIHYLSVDFINVHYLHSDYFDFQDMTIERFRSIMEEERVSAALIRPGISGLSPVVREYIAERMQRIERGPGGITLFVDPDYIDMESISKP